MIVGESGRANLPTRDAVTRSLAGSAITAAVCGVFARGIADYPVWSAFALKTTAITAVWIVLVLPWLLRAVFTLGLQGTLTPANRWLAAFAAALVEAAILVQPAFWHLSTRPAEGWDVPAETRLAVAIAIGPFLFAALRLRGASYGATVSANAIFFAALVL